MEDKRKILYLGLDPARYCPEGELHHYPLIATQPLPPSHFSRIFKTYPLWTHVVITSRCAADYFFTLMEHYKKDTEPLTFIVVGKATAAKIAERGCLKIDISVPECAEGVVSLLKTLASGYVFYPHSAQARPLIKKALELIPHTSCVLYETKYEKKGPLPHLECYDEIVFTSPSTVEAFISFYGALPPREKCRAIGPITEKTLDNFFVLSYGGP